LHGSSVGDRVEILASLIDLISQGSSGISNQGSNIILTENIFQGILCCLGIDVHVDIQIRIDVVSNSVQTVRGIFIFINRFILLNIVVVVVVIVAIIGAAL